MNAYNALELTNALNEYLPLAKAAQGTSKDSFDRKACLPAYNRALRALKAYFVIDRPNNGLALHLAATMGGHPTAVKFSCRYIMAKQAFELRCTAFGSQSKPMYINGYEAQENKHYFIAFLGAIVNAEIPALAASY